MCDEYNGEDYQDEAEEAEELEREQEEKDAFLEMFWDSHNDGWAYSDD